MSDGDKTFYRAAIFTAIPLEYQAVCAHLTNLQEERTTLETLCERGEFLANNRKWEVMIIQTGVGTAQAAAKTVYFIERFKPQVVIFVGIAGGIKDVKLGDVVVASQVYNYESGRADPSFQSRPRVYLPTPRIHQRATAAAQKKDWHRRLKESLSEPHKEPDVFIAPIASGNQVVASAEAAVLQLVHSHFNDAAAIEMEGFGFLTAAHLYREIEALVIRGISDLIDNKNETDKQQFQQIAAKRASAFAFDVLANLEIKQQSIPEKQPAETGSEEDYPNQSIPEKQPSGTDPEAKDPKLSLLEEFNSSLSGHIDNVKKIRDLLNKRVAFSSEQHKNAMKGLDDIEKYIEILLDTESPSIMISRRMMLAAMQKHIHDLKLELEKCHHTSQVIKSSQSRRAKNNEYDRAIELCDALLEEDLKQWPR